MEIVVEELDRDEPVEELDRGGRAPLTAAQRQALGDLIERVGEPEALRALGFSRNALYRALAGLCLQPGTRSLVREALSRAPRSAA